MTTESDLYHEELVHGWRGKDLSCVKGVKCKSDVPVVIVDDLFFSVSATSNDDIINLDISKIQVSEYFLHDSLKNGTGIFEAHGHDLPSHDTFGSVHVS